jgi:uncharacterized protein
MDLPARPTVRAGSSPTFRPTVRGRPAGAPRGPLLGGDGSGMWSGMEIAHAETPLVARASGALWWPEERLLCVADLHLGKSERLARRGGALLPPYETRETLDRLAAEVGALGPSIVVCLGDSFDDPAGATALEADDAARLTALMAGRDWIWIAGNHDPGPPPLGGTHLTELRRARLTFRHAAAAETAPGEISGHYHPKLRLTLKGASLSRPCFLFDAHRLILPAFGAYTGGLRADSPALRALLRAPVRAVLTGEPCLLVPG